MWPRRKRWSLMGSLAPPIPSRYGVATHEFYPEGTIPSPNYEVWDKESREWSADKNNAAINAAMARQASQTPQYDHTMGSSAGSAAPTGAAGSSKWKKVIEQLGKMTGPEPDWSLSPQKMGVPSPWSPTNVSWSAVGRPNNEFGVGRTMLDWKKMKGPY